MKKIIVIENNNEDPQFLTGFSKFGTPQFSYDPELAIYWEGEYATEHALLIVRHYIHHIYNNIYTITAYVVAQNVAVI